VLAVLPAFRGYVAPVGGAASPPAGEPAPVKPAADQPAADEPAGQVG